MNVVVFAEDAAVRQALVLALRGRTDARVLDGDELAGRTPGGAAVLAARCKAGGDAAVLALPAGDVRAKAASVAAVCGTDCPRFLGMMHSVVEVVMRPDGPDEGSVAMAAARVALRLPGRLSAGPGDPAGDVVEKGQAWGPSAPSP